MQHEYKRRHVTVAKLVCWKLCEKHNLERKDKWYKHCPEEVVEDDDVKLIWDTNIQCDIILWRHIDPTLFWWTKSELPGIATNHAS